MTSRRKEDEIVHVVATAVPALAGVRPLGIRLSDGDRARWLAADGAGITAGVRSALVEDLRQVPGDGGPVTVPGEAWAWAFGLRSLGELMGHLVVAAQRQPSAGELLLLRSLAQQAGISLANARLHARNESTNAELARTVQALRYQTAIHDRLTQVALAGDGQDGIVSALFELTGLPACVESRSGAVLASAGSPDPAGWPAVGDRRERVLQRATRVGHPIRVDGRLLTVARPTNDVVGVLTLLDPDGVAGDQETAALEHAQTVLTIELARLHSLAETELRLGRDLVADLVAGTGLETHQRARALGYDLRQEHRVMVVTSGRRDPRDPLMLEMHGSIAAALVEPDGRKVLLMQRGATVVALVTSSTADDRSRLDRLCRSLGPGARIGVGGACLTPDEFPRSHREARLSLRLGDHLASDDPVVRFDELGVYRLLAESADPTGLDELVERWLGPAVEHDARRNGELVRTVSRFLDCGGNYDATARLLTVGRTTVRYRLRRFRELTGHDLGDPETRFQVHFATKAWATRQALVEPSATGAGGGTADRESGS